MPKIFKIIKIDSNIFYKVKLGQIKLSKVKKPKLRRVLGWQNRSSRRPWGRKTEPQASFGVDLGSVWGKSGGAPGRFGRVRGGPGMALGKFSENRFFENRCTVCSLKRRIRWSGSGPKIDFDKISIPARPAWLDSLEVNSI